MKGMIVVSVLCAVLGLTQFEAAAQQVLLQEDFEAYTVGDGLNAIAQPWLPYPWSRDATANYDMTATWLGSICTATVENALVGGGKAAQLVDTATTNYPTQDFTGGMDALLTNDALKNANSGAGITRGSFQFDIIFKSTIDSVITNNIEFHLEDNDPMELGIPVALGTGEVDADQVLELRHLTTGNLRLRYCNSTGGVMSAVKNKDFNLAVTTGDAIRVSGEFDMADKSVIYRIHKWTGTDFSSELLDSSNATYAMQGDDGKVYMPAATGTPTITGLRMFKFAGQTTATPQIQFDNFIFTDLDAASGPEVAVSVDALDVPDGGTVNFGAPDVGATVTKTFTVSNTGTVDLTTANLTLPTGYSLAAGESLEATIAASASDTFVVELDTTTAAVLSGEITFETNDTDENPFNINVTADVGNTGVEDWATR